ncbi:MAG: hypothetical protein AAF497_29065 [Planctomycetota bacterium]
MNEHDPQFAELFEAYLDNQLDAEQRATVETIINSSDYWKNQLELQRQIDQFAQRAYEMPAELDIVPDELKSVDGSAAPAKDASHSDAIKSELAQPRSRRSFVAILAIAAGLLWALVAITWPNSDPNQVAFKPQPLTDVYQTCVSEGFQPYWLCDNDFVFATTFNRRQGVPLRLANLPEGQEMVGLSYLAGISRRSTSMLAKIDGRPVLVFVDQQKKDWHPETGYFSESGLNVFRRQKLGLVFYEVTPFDQPRLIEYFEQTTLEEAKKNANGDN